MFAPRLHAAGVEWMVAGGVAAIAYGEPRFTQDLDLVVALPSHEAARLATCFPADEFYCPPVEVLEEEARRPAFGHFNLLHLATDARADVYLAGEDPLARWGLAHRRTVRVMGLEVPMAPPEHVILHKLAFRRAGASERHLRDVRAILRALGDSIDVAALEREAVALGVHAEWLAMLALRD